MSRNTTWEINDASLSLDLSDAAQMERYENAFDAMEQDEHTIPKDGKQSAKIRAYCEMYRRLYDRIFGDGAAEKIFAGQPMSSDLYDEVYESFLAFVNAQIVSAAQRRAERISKYKPNRKQKRAIKKTTKK